VLSSISGTLTLGHLSDRSTAAVQSLKGRNLDGHKNSGNNATKTKATGLKPKDLVGIPWRVAFALQADGWYLRSDIIWSKPNPMPESVTDRPTKSHEYLFLLAKSERYYFDADAVRENICAAISGDRPHVRPAYKVAWGLRRGRQTLTGTRASRTMDRVHRRHGVATSEASGT
jgi:hypothetical protein